MPKHDSIEKLVRININGIIYKMWSYTCHSRVRWRNENNGVYVFFSIFLSSHSTMCTFSEMSVRKKKKKKHGSFLSFLGVLT